MADGRRRQRFTAAQVRDNILNDSDSDGGQFELESTQSSDDIMSDNESDNGLPPSPLPDSSGLLLGVIWGIYSMSYNKNAMRNCY